MSVENGLTSSGENAPIVSMITVPRSSEASLTVPNPVKTVSLTFGRGETVFESQPADPRVAR